MTDLEDGDGNAAQWWHTEDGDEVRAVTADEMREVDRVAVDDVGYGSSR